jgi:putative PIN family toxin of toxin-antitoxin system
MRVVLDTDVVVAALRSDRGASRQLLFGVVSGRLTLLLSVPLILEYEAVLMRPEHLAAAEMTKAEVTTVLDGLVALAEPVRLSFRWRPTLPDPQDDMVLETAVNGSANWLVTFNQRHFAKGAKSFEVEVVAPGAAIERLRSI